MKRDLQKFNIEDIWKLSSDIRNPPIDEIPFSKECDNNSEVSLFKESITKTLEVLE